MTPIEEAKDRQSHLFTVRVWLEDLGEDQTEWRGKIQHVLSGEVRYFRDWTGLVEQMKAMAHGTSSSETDKN
jgi:hypothetical protein